MKFLKIYEDFQQKPYREVDLQELWNFIKDREFMNKYYEAYDDETALTHNSFIEKLLREMLLEKEIAFHRVVNPIDDEVNFVFEGRVKLVWMTNNPVVALYYHKDPYYLAKLYNNPSIKNEQIIRIYNSEITEIEQNFEDIEMRLTAKKYNI
jgi:hypothetical protein